MRNILILGLVLLLVFVAGCSKETTEERTILTGSSVSEVDQMISGNAVLPDVENLTVEKPYDFDNGNEPVVEVEEPEVVIVPPAEYAQFIKEEKDDSTYPPATGLIEIYIKDLQTSYETITRFDLEIYNGLKREVKDPILAVRVGGITLKEINFKILARAESIIKEDFRTKIRIGEGEKEVSFIVGEYINNSFIELGKIEKTITAS